MRRALTAALIGLLTAVVSFGLTFFGFIAWAVHTYPQTNSMARLPAFELGVMVAPVCGLISVFVYLFRTRGMRKSAAAKLDV